MDRQQRQLRAVSTRFKTREDDNARHISGYFAVFNSIYEIDPLMSESIAPGAFSHSISGDIRALTNHDSTLVLGRTTAGTLQIREDEHGLWADVVINPNDTDALNTWARVNRGDVTQCSIGFSILKEDTEVRPDGGTHWTIRDVELFEVSVCTFPAYEATNIEARTHDREIIRRRAIEAWKAKAKEVLTHGPQSVDDQKEN